MGRKKNKPKDSEVKPKSKLTIKQRHFVNEVIKTRNLTEAANRAYDVKDRTNAKRIGTENWSKPAIKEAVNKGLRDAGLTDAAVFGYLEEAIREGVGRDARNSDALRGLDMVFKLRGSYAPKESKVTKTSVRLDMLGKDDYELMGILKDHGSAFDDVIEGEVEED